MANILEVILKLKDDFTRGMTKAEGNFKRFSKNMSDSFKSIATIPNLIAGTTIVGISKSLYDAATEFQGLQMKMNAAIPTFQGGQREMQYIASEANRMGLNLRTTASEYASFAAAALRSNISLKDTRKIFTDVSEAAVSMRLSNEKNERVMQALTQIASKGKVSMEELRLQLGDHLPGAVNIAAKSMGMTSSAFQDAVKNGEIMATDFLPKFAAQIKKELGGSFEEASNSVVANMNRMSNALFELKAQLGKVFTSKFFSDLVNQFSEGLMAINLMLEKKPQTDQNIDYITSIFGNPEQQIRSLEALREKEQERIDVLSKQRGELIEIQKLMEGRRQWGGTDYAGQIKYLNAEIEKLTANHTKYSNAIKSVKQSPTTDNKSTLAGDGITVKDGAAQRHANAVMAAWSRAVQESNARSREIAENAANWAYEDAQATFEAKQLYNQQIIDSDKLLQETQINIMAEGTAKELALLDLKYQEIKLKHQNNSDALFNIDKSYSLEKDKIEKAQAKSSIALISGNLQTMSGQWRGFMSAYKIMATAQAIIDTYSAANASYKAMSGIPYVGPVLGAAAAATAIGAGLANVMAIKAAKFASGGEFTTNGPMLMMVGDNRGGRERVSVTPQGSPNINGPASASGITLHIYDQSGSLAKTIESEVRSGSFDMALSAMFNRFGVIA